MTSRAAEWRLCGGWKLRAADLPWPLRSTNTAFQGDDVDEDACLQSMVANVFRFFRLPSKPWRMMAYLVGEDGEAVVGVEEKISSVCSGTEDDVV